MGETHYSVRLSQELIDFVEGGCVGMGYWGCGVGGEVLVYDGDKVRHYWAIA
jgi:hypothetical protein